MSVQVHPWYKDAGAVILAAGLGTRAKPATDYIPKPLLPIRGKPIINHVIEYWTRFIDPSRFVIVVNEDKGYPVRMYTEHALVDPVYVVQKEQRGIGDALLCAKDKLPEKFLIILADCLVEGDFLFPDTMGRIGIGIKHIANCCELSKNYGVALRDDPMRVCGVKEKPIGGYTICGTGFYWMDKRIFKYIDRRKCQQEIGITEILCDMISYGETISPIWMMPRYLNIGTLEDLAQW